MVNPQKAQALRCRKVQISIRTRGIALVSVLWLILLLTTIVLSLSRETGLSAKTAQIYVHEAQAHAKIEGAVYECIYSLLQGSPFASLQTKLRSEGVDVKRFELENQLNINTGTVTELKMVLSDNAIPNAEPLAQQIADFRHDYEKSRKSRQRNFEHILDLTRVPGISIEMIRALSNDITVLNHPTNGRVVSLVLAAEHGGSKARASVMVRFTGSSTDPYRILSWHWTTG